MDSTKRQDKKQQTMSRLEPITTGINLWEQWLQRLNYGQEPETRLNHRLELLSFVANNSPGSDQYFCRLGTILIHAFPVELIVISRGENDSEIIFTNCFLSERSTINKILKQSPKAPIGNFHRRNFIDVSVRRKQHRLEHHYRLGTNFKQESSIVIHFFTKQALGPTCFQYLEIFQSLISNRQLYETTKTQLKEEKLQFNSLVQRLNEGLIILNSQRKIELWNEAMTKLTHITADRAKGQSIEDILSMLSAEEFCTRLLQVEQLVFSDTLEVITKKGAKFLAISGSLINNPKGEKEQIILLFRDITKSRELEQQKNDFISIATHELRTPITAVRGYMSLLSKKPDKLDQKQLHYLNQARLAVQRLVDLSEDLLEVVRIQQNRIRFEIKPTPLLPIVQKIVDDFSSKASKKGLSIYSTTRLENPELMIDSLRFEQVLANLIDNAIKYTKVGQVKVEVFALTKSKQVAIEVSDTGMGMTSSEVSRAFDKFHRTHAAEHSGEAGAGLGLFIVKTFVEKMNGTIALRSKINQGSVFRLIFPLIEDNNKERS